MVEREHKEREKGKGKVTGSSGIFGETSLDDDADKIDFLVNGSDCVHYLHKLVIICSHFHENGNPTSECVERSIVFVRGNIREREEVVDMDGNVKRENL